MSMTDEQRARAIAERRFCVVYIDPDFVFKHLVDGAVEYYASHLTYEGEHARYRLATGDLVLHTAAYDANRACFIFTIVHPAFPPATPGEDIPIANLVFQHG